MSNDYHRNIDVSPGFFTRFGFDSVTVSIRLIRKFSLQGRQSLKTDRFHDVDQIIGRSLLRRLSNQKFKKELHCLLYYENIVEYCPTEDINDNFVMSSGTPYARSGVSELFACEDNTLCIINLWEMFRRSRAANTVVSGPKWPKFELARDLMHVLVTCKYHKRCRRTA